MTCYHPTNNSVNMRLQLKMGSSIIQWCYLCTFVVFTYHAKLLEGSVLQLEANAEVPVHTDIIINCTNASGSGTIIWDVKTSDGTLTICSRVPSASECGEPQNNQYRNGRVTAVHNGGGNSYAIKVTRVLLNETGNYRCGDTRENILDSYPNVRIIAPPGFIVSSVSSPVIESLQTTFICTSTIQYPGNPETILYTWLKDGEPTEWTNKTTGHWFMSDTQKSATGKYVCQVRNVAGESKSNDLDITVKYPPPGNPTIQNIPPSIVYEDAPLTITCYITGGEPIASVTWNCEELTLTPDSNSTTAWSTASGSVTRSLHGRKCSCTASHMAWMATGVSNKTTQTNKFNVYYPPGTPSLNLDKEVWLENHTYSAVCNSSNGNPANEYHWRLDGHYTSGGEVYNIKAKKGQQIVGCNVSNAFTSTKGNVLTAQKNLQVQYSPRVTTDNLLTLREFETKSISCAADSNPAAKINSDFRWTNQDGWVNSTSPVLLIDKATKLDAGVYTCHVSVRSEHYGLLNGTAMSSVTVKYLHIQSNMTRNITEDENLVLSCETEGVPDNITYSKWTHTGEYITYRVLEGKKVSATNNQLTITSVTFRDTGSYRCQASNKDYAEQAFSEVVVFYAPFSENYKHNKSHIASELYKPVNMSVTVRAYPRDVHFQWYFKNQTDENMKAITESDERFNVTNDQLSSALAINRFELEHQGLYRVEASNGVRSVRNFNFTLRVQGPPDAAQILRDKTKVTAVSVNLVWLSGFNGGFPQTFTVIYHQEGSVANMTSPDVKDPGYLTEANFPIRNLNESTRYTFTVRSRNSYNGGSHIDSLPVTFGTYARPTFGGGEFRVEYFHDRVVLSWPMPSGEFDRQTVQKRRKQSRRRRDISDCQDGCVEETVPLDQTTHTTEREPNQIYDFKLLLYDGEVVVQSIENTDWNTVFPPSDAPGLNIAAIVAPVCAVAVVIVVILGVLLYRRRLTQNQAKSRSSKQTHEFHNNAFRDVEAHGVLNAATTEEINPLYGAANYGDENANDIQPYAEVGHKPIIAKKPKQPLEGPVVYAEVNKKKNNDAEGPVLYAEVSKKKDKGKKGKEEEEGPVLYAEVNKKKGKGKKTDDGEGPVLYAEVNKKKDKGKKSKNEEDGPVLYAEVNKKKGKGKKTDADEGPVLYAEVNKKKDKGTKSKNEEDGPVLYAEVNKKKGKGKKAKDDVKDMYAEVDKKKNKKDKKKGKKDKNTEPEEGAYELCENTNKGVAAVNYPPPPEDHAYGNVVTEGEQTKPPPGSDGLVYAEVKIVKPPPRKPKPSSLKKQQEDEEKTMYADIDLTKKAAPLPPDEPPPPPAGPPPE